MTLQVLCLTGYEAFRPMSQSCLTAQLSRVIPDPGVSREWGLIGAEPTGLDEGTSLTPGGGYPQDRAGKVLGREDEMSPWEERRLWLQHPVMVGPSKELPQGTWPLECSLINHHRAAHCT